MKDSEKEVLRFNAADDAVHQSMLALKSICQKRSVRVQVALIAVVTTDGLICRTAFNPALCRGQQVPNVATLQSEVAEAMKSFVEEITGATVVEVDLDSGSPKS